MATTTESKTTPGGGGMPGPEEDLARRVFGTLAVIQEWVNEHRDRVRVGYLSLLAGGTFELTVVGTEKRFDFDLNRELADFAVRMVRGGVPLAAVLFPPTEAAVPPPYPKPIRILPD